MRARIGSDQPRAQAFYLPLFVIRCPVARQHTENRAVGNEVTLVLVIRGLVCL